AAANRPRKLNARGGKHWRDSFRKARTGLLPTVVTEDASFRVLPTAGVPGHRTGRFCRSDILISIILTSIARKSIGLQRIIRTPPEIGRRPFNFLILLWPMVVASR